MRKSLFSITLLFLSCYCSSQPKVETIELQGTKYTVTKNFPDDIKKVLIGLYQCDTDTGEPIIELKENGKGKFQRHGVPPGDIEFWVDCDEKGNIRKVVGPTGNFSITLLYKELEGKWAGEYNLMGAQVAKDGFGLPIENRPEISGSYTVILGERFKANK